MPIEYWNPTPIYYKDHDVIPECVSKEILSCEEKIEPLYEPDAWQDNVYSTINKCSNIVRHLKMVNLHEFLFWHLAEYFKELNFVPSETKLYTSWFNKTYKHGFQDLHTHQMNCVSGCLYYDMTSKQENGIQFLCNKHNFDTETINYDYKPGRMILFPGNVYHRVPYKKTEGVRKSFSFNVAIF